jgi:hypothetical protein
VEAVGLGVEGVLSAGLLQQGPQLGAGEMGGLVGGGGGGQQGASDGVAHALAADAHRGEEAGEVLAQVRGELVGGLGAVPHRVLLGAGEDRDGLGEFGVGGQSAVGAASVRRMLASTIASRWSDFLRETAWRSR